MRRAHALLGVDIGYQNCKVALVEHGRDGPSVTRVAAAPVPAGAWVGDRLAAPEAVGDTLAALCRSHGIACRAAVAAIPIRTAHLRQLSLPLLPAREVAAAVRWEVQRFLSRPVEEAEVDYAILARHADEGAASLDVLAAAAPADVVGSYHAALRRAGLEAVAIEVEPLALWRLARLLAGVEDAGVQALLDVGAYRSSLLVFEGRLLHLARPLPVGGAAFTESLARARSLPWEEAEALKLQPGGAVLEEAAEVFDSLAAELHRSFRYFQQTHPHARVQRLLLSGGGAALPGLAPALSVALGVPVQELEPSPLLAGATRATAAAARYAVALGLALRPADPGAPQLDLLRPRLPSRAERRRRLQTRALAVLLGLNAASLALWLGASLAAGGARQALAALEARGGAATPAPADWEAALRARDRRLDLLAPLLRRPVQARLVDLGARLAPAGVDLQRVAADEHRLDVSGSAATTEALAQYLEALGREPGLSAVALQEAARSPDGRVRFRLSARVAGPPPGQGGRP